MIKTKEMKNFVLKANETVWVNIIPKKGKIDTRKAEIEGFSSIGIYYKNHPTVWHHFCSGLFYGFGYHNDGYAVVCKKKWHLYPAILLEKIRLKIPEKLSRKLHLEN